MCSNVFAIRVIVSRHDWKKNLSLSVIRGLLLFCRTLLLFYWTLLLFYRGLTLFCWLLFHRGWLLFEATPLLFSSLIQFFRVGKPSNRWDSLCVIRAKGYNDTTFLRTFIDAKGNDPFASFYLVTFQWSLVTFLSNSVTFSPLQYCSSSIKGIVK